MSSSTYGLSMSFHWVDLEPKFVVCTNCQGNGRISDPHDDSVGFLGATIPCPCCRDGKVIDDSEIPPPPPKYIIEEMKRHWDHVFKNKAEYLKRHEELMASKASMDSSYL